MHFDPLTRIQAPDFLPRDSVRLPDGTLIVAGQTGIYEADRRARPQTPSEAVADGGALVYGTRAPGPRAPQLTPTGLGVRLRTGESGNVTGETAAGAAVSSGHVQAIFRVSSGAAFETFVDDDEGDWLDVLTNCATGDGLMANYWDVADGCYILKARYFSIKQPYEWPGDWARYSGLAAPPDWYSWRHPDLGVVQYDPIFAVGALPYNAGDARQARLLDAREEAVRTGVARRHREWDGKLIIFDEEGETVAFDGETAALRIIVGDGDWIGDANVHPHATVGTPLLRTDQNGELSPWVIEPRLRAANVLLLEEQTLWIGGMRATRNGRETVLIKVDAATGAAEFTAHYVDHSERKADADGWQNNGITGIARGFDGVLRVWTPEVRLRLRQFFGMWILEDDGDDEGRGETRGGWCPTIALCADGSSIEAVGVEHPSGLNDGVLEIRGSVSNWINGAPLATLGANILAPRAGAIWGVIGKSGAVQELGYTTNGAWRMSAQLSELRRERLVARCGKYLLLVGEDARQTQTGFFAPSTISRFSKDNSDEYSGHFDYAPFQVRSIHETSSLDGKRDSALFIGEDANGFAVWESDGRDDIEIAAQNVADGAPGFDNARAAFERLDAATAGGCRVYFQRVPFAGELSAWGVAWGDELAAWIQSADFPAVWFAPDIEIDYSVTLDYPSPALLTQIAGVTEWMPAHATKGGIYWPRKRAHQGALLMLIAPVGLRINAPVKAVY